MLRILVFALSAFICFICSVLVCTHQTMPFDQSVIAWIEKYRTDTLTMWFLSIGQFGTTKVLAAIAILAFLLCLWKKRWLNALLVLVSLGGSYLLNTLLKWIFQRERPHVISLIEADGYSFPSGNAMISVSFYGLLIYYLCTALPSISENRHRWQIISFMIRIIAIFLIVNIGLSRVYLGVHYPSDILSGFCFGMILLIVFIRLDQQFDESKPARKS